MVLSVKKIKDGVFEINDAVVISNIEGNEDNTVVYDLDYDEKILTEEESIELANEFIHRAVSEILKNQD